MKLESASPTELRTLVEHVACVSDPLHAWLTAALDSPPDPHYISLTALTMAADEARVILQASPDDDYADRAQTISVLPGHTSRTAAAFPGARNGSQAKPHSGDRTHPAMTETDIWPLCRSPAVTRR
jgi:hypothetical protein